MEHSSQYGRQGSWKDSAQEAADRATGYVQETTERATGYMQDTLQRAESRLQEMAGRPLTSFTSEAQRFIREHPLQSAAIVIAVGYILGKLLQRS